VSPVFGLTWNGWLFAGMVLYRSRRWMANGVGAAQNSTAEN